MRGVDADEAASEKLFRPCPSASKRHDLNEPGPHCATNLFDMSGSLAILNRAGHSSKSLFRATWTTSTDCRWQLDPERSLLIASCFPTTLTGILRVYPLLQFEVEASSSPPSTLCRQRDTRASCAATAGRNCVTLCQTTGHQAIR
jgi:hypothetical protein